MVESSGNIPPPAQATQANLNLEARSPTNQVLQQQIYKVPVGAQFIGQVVGNDKNGNAIVRLAGNDLILSSPVALSKGAQLNLKVASASEVITLQLLSVDGKLPPTQPQATSNQLQSNPQNLPILKLLSVVAEPQAQNTQTTAKTAAPLPVLGTTESGAIKAVLINPSADALQNLKAQITTQLPEGKSNQLLQTLPTDLKAGSELGLKISNNQGQQLNPLSNQAAGSENVKVQGDNKVLAKQDFHVKSQQGQNAKSPAATPNPTNPNTTPTSATTAPAPNSSAGAPVTNAAAASDFKPQIQINSSGNINLTAQVLGGSGKSELLIQTPLGKLVIANNFAQGSVKPGTTLNLQVTEFGQIIDNPQVKSESPLKALATEWATLRELAISLTNNGQPSPLNKLAGLDSIFASRLANYFSSVKTGNIHNWLSSELLNSLEESTREQLLGKFRVDFANMRSLQSEQPNSWQTFLFPVFDGEELHQAQFHIKDLEEESEEKGKGTRFIVEIDTRALGEIQLDGLYRSNSMNRNFDLMVRSTEELDNEIQGGVIEIFQTAAEVAGFKGKVDFAMSEELPNQILDEKLSAITHSDGSIEV